MENVIEIAPNQLPLFDLLTDAQEIELARLKFNIKRDTDRREKEVLDKVALLEKAGFTSRHYQYSAERVINTRSLNVAKWNETPKLVETEVEEFKGTCCLLYSRFDKGANEIVTAKVHFDIHNGKIECYAITDNWRKYKPESILAKIEESYEISANRYDNFNQQQSTINYTVNKYKQLYPDAEVTSGREYMRRGKGYYEYDIVTIKFKSGSYVVFEVFSTRDKERLDKKHDAVSAQLSNSQLLDYFNTQPLKEAR